MTLKLYDFFRSSAAYRVRIALNLKNITPDVIPIHLTKDGGEQHAPAYRDVNPLKLVPAIEVDGTIITQSLAIIEYLDERYPTPPLFPSSTAHRALVRGLALTIAADIHPIQNLRVLEYLRKTLHLPEDQVIAWARHWVEEGLKAFEVLVERSPVQGQYCFGDHVTLADIMLAPQMVNARRFECDLSLIPKLVKIDERLRALPAFAKAAPEAQSGAT